MEAGCGVLRERDVYFRTYILGRTHCDVLYSQLLSPAVTAYSTKLPESREKRSHDV